MRKLAFALAALATLGLSVPALASGQHAHSAKVITTKPHAGIVNKHTVRHISAAKRHWQRCRVVTVKTRHGHRVVVKKVRRCH
jgi:hypothetical protein